MLPNCIYIPNCNIVCGNTHKKLHVHLKYEYLTHVFNHPILILIQIIVHKFKAFQIFL
jgi:hypothetical protein